MKFRGISGWWSGVAAMGVLLIAYLSGLGIVANAASTTQGWQVRIGDQDPVNVTENDIDTVLFQGEFRLETRLDPSANSSARSVCVGFPKVKASRNIDNNDDHSIELRLDMDDCQIVVNDVKRTNISGTMSSASSESHEEHWGRAVVKAAEVPILGPLGFDLTESKVMIDYASSLNVYGSSHSCEVFSPALFVGVEWHNDDCVSSKITHHGTYLKTKTTGDFHATRDDELWDDSVHTSSAEIKGYSTKYVITCEWSPPSIEDLTWGILNVKLLCKNDEGVI